MRRSPAVSIFERPVQSAQIQGVLVPEPQTAIFIPLFLSPPPPPCDLTQASAGVLVTFQPSSLSIPSLTAGGVLFEHGQWDGRHEHMHFLYTRKKQQQWAAERKVVKHSSSAASKPGDVLCALETIDFKVYIYIYTHLHLPYNCRGGKKSPQF